MTLWGNSTFTTEVNEWMGAHMRGGDSEYGRFLRLFYVHLAKKIEELGEGHATDRHPHTFGVSGAGDCSRIPQLTALGFAKEFSAGFHWTFWLGHMIECAAYALLEVTNKWKIISTQEAIEIPGDYEFPLFATKSDGIVERIDTGVRYAFSAKSDSYKMGGYFRGRASRKGFGALPVEGPKGGHLLQSKLECYGMKPRLDDALIFVLAKDFVPAYETEDDIMRSLGSAVAWIYDFRADHGAIEKFVLPVWREKQRDVVNGVVGAGVLYDKESGLFRAIDSRVDNKKVNGLDWDRCKWATGECSMRQHCLKAYGK